MGNPECWNNPEQLECAFYHNLISHYKTQNGYGNEKKMKQNGFGHGQLHSFTLKGSSVRWLVGPEHLDTTNQNTLIEQSAEFIQINNRTVNRIYTD